MSDRLQAAQAALNSGRRDEAIEHLIAAVAEAPGQPVNVYRILTVQLYNAGRFEEGEQHAAAGLKRYPRDYDLLNVHGVMLRKLKRQREAAPVLERAIKLKPNAPAAQQNLGNVLLDLGEHARAEAVFSKLVRAEPRNSEYHRQLGRTLARRGKIEPALTRLRAAVSIKRDNVEAWLDLAGCLSEEFRIAEAQEALAAALAANPGAQKLLEARALTLRRGGDLKGCQTFLEELLPANPDAAWLQHQLGSLVSDWDRDRANRHFERAHELEPDRLEYATALVESLERTRLGDEGGHIERAYQLALTLLPRKPEFSDSTNKVMIDVFVRVCDYDGLDAVGDFKTLGRGWAQSGRHTALLKQIARVRGDDDRQELVEQHRIWGRAQEEAAARRTVKRPPPRPLGPKIRLGFMSSDLRAHPVGYFAMPLFDHIDTDRFEVFIYSFYQGREDAAQRAITEKVTAYRWWPEASITQAAERIAADQLDLLIELGGSTHMNKLEVMAYRPAPLQASWLGYPHSAGLSTIDWFICDPITAPPRRELLIETPLLMPRSWIALGARFFSNTVEIGEAPELRNGFITYGTANNPHKYTRDVLRTWAKVVAATPGSKFAFIRPEASGESFRRNIEKQFAVEGVTPDRLVWHAIRGAHLPYYNEVDITLDPFPLTGGTTTAETLWMGVPLVSLTGPAFYERLSASIMTNSGVGDLAVDTREAYLDTAVTLAANRERRLELRRSLRDRMRQGPLGQTEQFAKDFYDMIHAAVTAKRG